MEMLHAVILGIIQGITEFLPVSSSGHLVICQYLFNISEPPLGFDISVHIGTLIAVVICFRHKIMQIFSLHSKTLVFIIAGSLPTAIIGIILMRAALILFSSVLISGVALILTGIFLWTTRKCEKRLRYKEMSLKRAFLIGIVQGLAVVPGISRSGATIGAGLHIGLKPEDAVEFSFLLMIPAVAGAAIIESISAGFNTSIDVIITGTVISLIVGMAALKLLLYTVKKRRIHIFAPYCILIGMLSVGLYVF